MGIHRRQRNWGCRVHETELYGIRTVVLENDLIRTSFLAGKGSDLIEFDYKPRGMDFAWLAPGGIRNPLELHSTAPDPLGTFIDVYPGGWQDIFPNAGAASRWAGAVYGQHGEVSALPWDVEIATDTEEEVAVRFMLRGIKAPCTLVKVVRLRLGQPEIEVEESVTNDCPVPFQAMWGQHITFGRPFLEAGVRIRLPKGIRAQPHDVAVGGSGRRAASTAAFEWPIGIGASGQSEDFSVVPPQGTASDLFYLSGFPEGSAWYEVVNLATGLGMRIEWDAQTLPYLWYWQEFGATIDYPWYGRMFTIGLEPSSSFPTNGLPDAVANGSAIELAPGETRSYWLRARVLEGAR